jgi:uncharacterized membrane protein YkoI
MNRRHLKLVAVIVLLGIMLCAAAYAKKDKEKSEQPSPAKATETERKVTEAEVPADALLTLKKMAAGAKIIEFAEEVEDDQTFYEGSWKAPSGVQVDVLVTKTGDLVAIEEGVSADEVPAAVLKAARKAAGSGAELALERKTTILYEIKFEKAGAEQELLLTPDGRKVEEDVQKGQSDNDDEDNDDEKQQVSIDQVPAAVRATILKEAGSGKIEKIVLENEDGRTIYEAEVIMDGKEFDVKVAADGTLGKEVEDEENDKDN